MSENAKLIRGPIRGHLVSQTLPMIIGVAAIMSIGLVDAYFIGQLGKDALAAISFIFPVSVAITSLGVGIMVGINSVVARALGEGDDEKAARRANFGILVAIATGLVIGALLYLLLDPLFRLMQAPDDLMPLIETYMRPYALGFPLMLTIMGMNGVLRGQGEARRTSIVSISYAAANWVLDPLLITGAFGYEGLGMVGAAYATIIGWAIGVAVAIRLLKHTVISIDLALVRNCHVKDPLLAILRVAGPAAFSNAINPIGLSVLTALIASQGADAVAGFGAAGRLQSFAVVPLLGLSGAIGAIVGQNWGAGRPDRSRLAMLEAGLFCIGWGLAIAVLLYFQGDWFAGFFSEDPQVQRYFTDYLRIAAWGYAGFGLLIVGNGALNAIDRASFALGQSAARVFLVMLPIAWFLRPDWGASAIFAAELAANLAGGLVSAFLVWRLLRKRPEPTPPA
ncbi:Multi antimicrobial extrusion protein (Na(+) /drug antiporter), MATE family of MDR efflux pump [Altererythrobacter epoxidivorans]|uniref:Multi antimicrobial extrusion protein (Na(+) /drug antiporter), MATE family of MDR efflux pump n=1 Tax=Altererythrobacter epoxidivorans TaxID=361183 RepID=A0A0M3TAN3_9SPHN|nr:MATE family efflux transporter [Altererythrobacter epoxidivorans]ALE17352.1 Multi antimicrobial extrusion protein (Na(+) /drug antiporter), MATE family of MDR efflux pump [Altererythrobacter epoxidivorans]